MSHLGPLPPLAPCPTHPLGMFPAIGNPLARVKGGGGEGGARIYGDLTPPLHPIKGLPLLTPGEEFRVSTHARGAI